MKPAYVSFVHISEHMFSSLLLYFCVFFMWQDIFMVSVFLSLCLLPLEEVSSALSVLQSVCTYSVRPPRPSAGSSLRSLDLELVTV